MKSADRINESKISKLGMKLVLGESSQVKHEAVPNFTRGMSRAGTINCPSRSLEHYRSRTPPKYILILSMMSSSE